MPLLVCSIIFLMQRIFMSLMAATLILALMLVVSVFILKLNVVLVILDAIRTVIITGLLLV